MVIREDADIGSVVVGDIHKKSKCAQLRQAEVIELLSSLRSTQLNLLYCGLGLQQPTDDIAEDVAATRTLVGEFRVSIHGGDLQSTKGFIAEVQDAMTMDGRVVEVIPSQKDVNVRGSSCTEDEADSEKDLGITTMKTVTTPTPLSPDGLLCTMHAKSPCTPTDLQSKSDGGLWIQRTPSLSFKALVVSAPRDVESSSIPAVDGDNAACSTERVVEMYLSTVSHLAEATTKKQVKKKTTSPLVDNSQDDVISRTTHKSDGRYYTHP